MLSSTTVEKDRRVLVVVLDRRTTDWSAVRGSGLRAMVGGCGDYPREEKEADEVCSEMFHLQQKDHNALQ